MEYYSPKEMTEEEIVRGLSTAKNDNDIIDLVISALYFCETKFAGHILLSCLRNMNSENKIYLIINVLSYMQMHETNHLFSEIFNEVNKNFIGMEKHQTELNDTIDGMNEFNDIFKDDHRNLIQERQ